MPTQIRIWTTLAWIVTTVLMGSALIAAGLWKTVAIFVAIVVGLMMAFAISGLVTRDEVRVVLEEEEYHTAEELADAIASCRGLCEIEEFGRPNPSFVGFILAGMKLDRRRRYVADENGERVMYSYRRPKPRPKLDLSKLPQA